MRWEKLLIFPSSTVFNCIILFSLTLLDFRPFHRLLWELLRAVVLVHTRLPRSECHSIAARSALLRPHRLRSNEQLLALLSYQFSCCSASQVPFQVTPYLGVYIC